MREGVAGASALSGNGTEAVQVEVDLGVLSVPGGYLILALDIWGLHDEYPSKKSIYAVAPSLLT